MKDFLSKIIPRFSRDLTQELESMKQLLKEIVNKITQNLLGKSPPIESSPERLNHDTSHSVYDRFSFLSFDISLSVVCIRVNYPCDLLYIITMI